MPEGFSAPEVAKEISDHAHHATHGDASGGAPWIAMLEAGLLAVVTVLAPWSGLAAAKWSTESSFSFASASATRTQASRAELSALETRNFDASTFNTWVTAYTARDAAAQSVAIRRFRPAFRVAFDAWIATKPFTNVSAPPGPTYMK